MTAEKWKELGFFVLKVAAGAAIGTLIANNLVQPMIDKTKTSVPSTK